MCEVFQIEMQCYYFNYYKLNKHFKLHQTLNIEMY